MKFLSYTQRVFYRQACEKQICKMVPGNTSDSIKSYSDTIMLALEFMLNQDEPLLIHALNAIDLANDRTVELIEICKGFAAEIKISTDPESRHYDIDPQAFAEFEKKITEMECL